MAADDHWRRVYEAKRPDEVSWYQPLPEPSLDALDRLNIGPEDSLVDVGGGASSLADALLDRGWNDLTVVDIAAPALEASQARLGSRSKNVDWLVADIRHWRPARTFGVWHDRAVFHFFTEESGRAAYVEVLRAATQVDSHAIIATFAADGPQQCSGLPVQRYDAESLAAALGDGFSPIESWRQAHVTPQGATQNFQWCAFRRV